MKTVKISSFLKERKIKLKPQAANCSGLQRIEKIDFSGKIYLSPVQTNTDMILVKSGDLVISGINVEKGALAIYTGEEDVLASIHYSAYEFDAEKIDIDYLKWFLKSNIFRKLLLKQTGSGIKKEIKAKHLLPIEIQLPSLKQQHEIVQQIQGVANYIEEVNRQIQQQAKYAEMLRQSILQQAVEGKLCEQDPNDEPASVLLEKIKAEKERLVAEKKIKKQKSLPPISEEEKPFALPKGWEWCRLGELLKYTDAGKSPACEERPAKATESGVIKTTAIQNYLFDESQNKVLDADYPVDPKMLIKDGDILITRAGPFNRTGIVCYVQKCKGKLILSDKTVRLNVIENVNPKYIARALNASGLRKIIEEKMTGMALSQVNITQENMRYFLIPVPPFNEQNRIVLKINEVMELCDLLEHEICNAKNCALQLMESVLQEAFSIQETTKPAQVIEFHSNQTTPETELLAAARGKLREDTWEHLCKRAMEIAGEES